MKVVKTYTGLGNFFVFFFQENFQNVFLITIDVHSYILKYLGKHLSILHFLKVR